MDKIKVRTTGNFMLFDRSSGCEILPGDEPSHPELTDFIRERVALGQLVDVDGVLGGEPAPEPEPAPAEEPVQEPVQEQPAEEAAAPVQEQAAEEAPRDEDGDGHDDKTGNFVEGNKAAAKKGKRGK